MTASTITGLLFKSDNPGRFKLVGTPAGDWRNGRDITSGDGLEVECNFGDGFLAGVVLHDSNKGYVFTVEFAGKTRTLCTLAEIAAQRLHVRRTWAGWSEP